MVICGLCDQETAYYRVELDQLGRPTQLCPACWKDVATARKYPPEEDDAKCPHCGHPTCQFKGEVVLKANSEAKMVFQCQKCEKQFTV